MLLLCYNAWNTLCIQKIRVSERLKAKVVSPTLQHFFLKQIRHTRGVDLVMRFQGPLFPPFDKSAQSRLYEGVKGPTTCFTGCQNRAIKHKSRTSIRVIFRIDDYRCLSPYTKFAVTSHRIESTEDRFRNEHEGFLQYITTDNMHSFPGREYLQLMRRLHVLLIWLQE